MPSRHANAVPILVRDIHNLLVAELALSVTFKATDPELGESYGFLSAQSLVEGENRMVQLECLFTASASFGSYWESMNWVIITALNLDNFLPQIKSKVNSRVLVDFDKSESISVGQPRSPIKGLQSQKSAIWVVDVLMPCTIKLAIIKDAVCGHL